MKFHRVWLWALLLTVLVSAGVAQTGKGKGTAKPAGPKHFMIAPDGVKWEAPPEGMATGTPSVAPGGELRDARIEGDPAKAGAPYSIELSCTDGLKVAPHWHPRDENIMILQGTFAIGSGDQYKPAATHDMATGTYGFMPRRVHHFGSCKGETKMLIYGTGPFTINWVGAPAAGK